MSERINPPISARGQLGRSAVTGFGPRHVERATWAAGSLASTVPPRGVAGDPERAAGRRELLNQGAGGAFEIQAQLRIFGVTRDPGNGVGGAPCGVALGQVDDIGGLEGVDDRLLDQLG